MHIGPDATGRFEPKQWRRLLADIAYRASVALVRRPAEEQQISLPDAFVVLLERSRMRRLHQSSDDCAGICNHELAVQNEKLLDRHHGFNSAAAGDVWVGKIEKSQHPREVMTADRRVQRSAPLVA